MVDSAAHHYVRNAYGFSGPFSSSGGAPSGAPRRASGAPNEKSRQGPAFNLSNLLWFFGAGEEIRTLDVNLGKVALYH